MLTNNSLRINLSKELAMTRFASPYFPHFPSAHHTVGAPVKSSAPKNASGSKTLAGMLLAATLAAFLVVADQLIETWVDGHMLVGWVALWTVTFAALALLAPPLRQWTSAMAAALARWSQAATQRSMEEKMWEYAQHDSRIMAELQHAYMRSQRDI